MPYIYSRVMELENTAKVGSTECVALVQIYAAAPHTSLWKAGAKLLGNHLIAPGTAIATFVGERYPNRPHGNHAALFIRQDGHGVWVMDQWSGNTAKPLVSQRVISLKRQHRDGNCFDSSNNAGAFHVIERR